MCGGTNSGSREGAFGNRAKPVQKTLAKAAEQKRRRELEEGFNNLEDVRQERFLIELIRF